MAAPLLLITRADLGYEKCRVLRNVTLRVEERDFLVLHGSNGGGKTTLLRLMAGLLRPTAGHIERRAGLRVGYLPQYRSIDRQFPLTVSDVVRSGLIGSKPLWRPYSAAARRQATEMMQRLQIAALADRPIAELSGGQWQRALLGRALVSDPELLLLDEPDTHLDQQSRSALYDILISEARSRAVVIVSHDPAVATRFSSCRSVCVENGTVNEEEESAASE